MARQVHNVSVANQAIKLDTGNSWHKKPIVYAGDRNELGSAKAYTPPRVDANV
jgi:hypothetical protein